MPRFHFNVHDGVSRLDLEGTELPDWHAARLVAIRHAGEIMQDEAERVALGDDWRLEVTDHTGLILFQMTFLFIDAPTLLRARGAEATQ